MNQIIIADSTCLIGLERIGKLEILPQLFDSILVPPKVAEEFGIPLSWLDIVKVTDQGLVLALTMIVDDGEAEAITLAYETKIKVILDDQQARKVARNMNVSFIGTIGILIQAKQRGVIKSIKPLLDDLENNNFYLSKNLKQEALNIVNEI
jgi:predicted nucleic acid-binding protein